MPPESVRLPLDVPAVLIDTIMFSIEAAVRAQFSKALAKFNACVLLNAFAGKFAKLVQLTQVELKPTSPVIAPETRGNEAAGKVVS